MQRSEVVGLLPAAVGAKRLTVLVPTVMVLLGLLLASPSEALTPHVTLEEMCSVSDIIFEGTVADTHFLWGDVAAIPSTEVVFKSLSFRTAITYIPST